MSLITLESFVKSSRRVSTPIISISTIDQLSTEKAIIEALGENGNIPIVSWTSTVGWTGKNQAGSQAITKICGTDLEDIIDQTRDSAHQLSLALQLPPTSVLFMHCAHRWTDEATVSQGILSLRDQFKTNRRTLILLGPHFRFPSELQQDVIMYDEELPTDEAIQAIAVHLISEANIQEGGIPQPNDETLSSVTDALRGLGSFTAEQCLAMCMKKSGYSLDELWDRKRQAVEATPGLGFFRGGFPVLDDVGGLFALKRWAPRLMQGPESPRLIVFIDEIEKMLGGAYGAASDNTGVSQDYLGSLLRWMDGGFGSSVMGALFIGHPGGGKSFVSRAIGNTHNRPTVTIDLGAMKGGIVGESERNIRQAIKVCDSISGGSALVLATCNRLDSVPNELRRRFNLGTWFFDLPTKEERDSIWKIHLKRRGYKEKDRKGVDDTDLTGADIRNIVDTAYALGVSLSEASLYATVPVAKADPASIERLRQFAHGKFQSASMPGVYQAPVEGRVADGTPSRSFDFSDSDIN